MREPRDTDAIKRKIETALSEGASFKGACHIACIPMSTARRWYRSGNWPARYNRHQQESRDRFLRITLALKTLQDRCLYDLEKVTTPLQRRKLKKQLQKLIKGLPEDLRP